MLIFHFRQRPLALKVTCPCLKVKELRFVVGEVATSFQDVHAMFLASSNGISSHKNKIK